MLLANDSQSTILLMAAGRPCVAIPPTGPRRGQVEGDDSAPVEVAEADLEVFGAEMVGPEGKQVSQLDYFAKRGLRIVQ